MSRADNDYRFHSVFVAPEISIGSGAPQQVNPKVRRILVTYGDTAMTKAIRDVVKERTYRFEEVALDSGAFTKKARRGGISREGYADFVLENRECFTHYINFDVMGNPDQTARNQRYLEGRGLDPIPVWHAGSPLSVLEDLCADYDYICIGNIVRLATRRHQLWNVLEPAFSRIPGDVRVHLLGISDYPTLVRYPCYSSDSRRGGINVRRFCQTVIFHSKRQTWMESGFRDVPALRVLRDWYALQGLDVSQIPDDPDIWKTLAPMYLQTAYRSGLFLERCVREGREVAGTQFKNPHHPEANNVQD